MIPRNPPAPSPVQHPLALASAPRAVSAIPEHRSLRCHHRDDVRVLRQARVGQDDHTHGDAAGARDAAPSWPPVAMMRPGRAHAQPGVEHCQTPEVSFAKASIDRLKPLTTHQGQYNSILLQRRFEETSLMGLCSMRLQAYKEYNARAVELGRSRGHFLVDLCRPGHMTACLRTFQETIHCNDDNWDAHFGAFAAPASVQLRGLQCIDARRRLLHASCGSSACRWAEGTAGMPTATRRSSRVTAMLSLIISPLSRTHEHGRLTMAGSCETCLDVVQPMRGQWR